MKLVTSVLSALAEPPSQVSVDKKFPARLYLRTTTTTTAAAAARDAEAHAQCRDRRSLVRRSRNGGVDMAVGLFSTFLCPVLRLVVVWIGSMLGRDWADWCVGGRVRVER